MKSITIIFLLLSTLGFSQNLDFKPTNDEFCKEFIRLIDSTRTSMYGQQTFTYINPDWSSSKYRKSKGAVKWITQVSEFNTQIDSNASKACEHHNRFLYYLVIGEDDNPSVNGHVEDSIIAGYKYKGTDTLLNNSHDRCNYYCGDLFKSFGECVWGSNTKCDLIKDMNSIELARAAYNTFMASTKGHRDILINKVYTDCGINLYVDPEYKSFRITFVIGQTKKAKS